ncbi:helix-turn-helix transcriptional regulator [Rhodocytophaga aerolata]|uniref:Helix-turn-helix transcriptional regulator n=1 Tax=Rhodocytophaga aerolata TaxID=455078 RepID=A0ABT8RGU3_9BACT|nr:helix-turn-helix transcriptional regulator [Rhodocytophaga aerolata]MDO1451322.1 helix-turn-helix transcriptional regulator [Rhodocytophaga aerolata]
MKKRTSQQKEQTRKAMGKRISDLRKLKGFTLNDLAERSGKKVQSIHRAEKGQVNVSIAYLDAIAGGLGMKVNELLDFQMF